MRGIWPMSRAMIGNERKAPVSIEWVSNCARYSSEHPDVYSRENSNGYEWDERRGVNIIEELDEALPTIGLGFEYSWTPGE
jgi:hypothetical protein